MTRIPIHIALLLCGFGALGELPQPPPGWNIAMVASSPDVQHPSVVCVAADGRVFVAEDPMDIRLPANSANGRILCFHPDGRRTIFAEKLFAVFGMQYLEGKLYVLHNPRFTVFRDEHGVGKDAVDLIESTNPKPWALDWNDHVPANFKLAMDGYFYVAVGDKGLFGAVGRDGKRVDLHGGGIVRIRPDGTGLEIFSTGVRNILDVAIDADDEIFTYDNTDEHEWMGRLTHMVDGGFYGYPFDFIPRRDYTLWMMADFGGGAATGTLCYNEDALPPEYHGNLFLADFGKRQILRVRLERDGATFRVRSKEDFFREPPEDFRPVGIALSADGLGIYICDWQHRDIKADARVGRLLKVTYQGLSNARQKPIWFPDAAAGRQAAVSKAELAAALTHPSQAVRLCAQRLLLPEDVVTITNVHSLWIDPKRAPAALEHSDPAIRRQALRVLSNTSDASMLKPVEAQLSHQEASVRFHAATALGRIGDESSVPALLRAAAEPDPWVRYAISRGLNRIGKRQPAAWPRIVEVLRDSEKRLVAINALRETYDTVLLMALIKNASHDEAAVRLVSLIHRKPPEWKGDWWAYHPFRLSPPARTVAWEGTAPAADFILSALTNSNPAVRLAALEGISETKDHRALPALAEAMKRPTALTSTLAALNQIGGPEAQTLVIKYLMKPSGTETNIQQALDFLERHAVPGCSDLLERYITHNSENIRTAALNALVKGDPNAAAARIIPLLQHSSIAVRVSAIVALGRLRNDAAFGALLNATSNPDLRESSLLALTRVPDIRALDSYLDGLSSHNLKLREAIRKALTTIREAAWPLLRERVMTISPELRRELALIYKGDPDAQKLFATDVAYTTDDYLAFGLKEKGSAEAGRLIFYESSSVACSQCHTIRNRGAQVGPDLTTAGTQFSRRELAESILFPSRAVREGYQAMTIETSDQSIISGLLKGETGEELQVLDSSGQLHRIAKSRVQSRQNSALSLMPEGLHSALTLREFSDLLAFLESLK